MDKENKDYNSIHILLLDVRRKILHSKKYFLVSILEI